MNDELKIVETNDGHFHRCKWLIDQAKRYKTKILDIGCNDGFLLRDHIIDEKEKLDVIETDLQYIFPKEYRYKIKFVKCDAEYLPFKDNSFMCSILGDMLEHVKDPVRVLKNVSRISKNIYMTVPNEWEWNDDKRPFQFAPHLRFYTEKSLREDLNNASLNNKYNIFKLNGGGWSFWCVSICL